MKRHTTLTLLSLLVLCVASVAWAGGSSCTSDQASASTTAKPATPSGNNCPVKGAQANAAPHCTGKGASTSAMTCDLSKNQTMYSFAVPSVECDHCVTAVQTALMQVKGVECAHVDLPTHAAYVIVDKNVSEKQLSKAITEAGFKNKYTAKGSKAEASFAKAMASGDKSMACCAKGKDKV
jgi:copper chaperone CopZ